MNKEELNSKVTLRKFGKSPLFSNFWIFIAFDIFLNQLITKDSNFLDFLDVPQSQR